LEFVQFISATNETLALCIAKIADNTTDDTAALTAAEEIAKACFDTLKALDGKQVRKYTIIALGTRVRDYKQQIASARQQLHPDQKFSAESVDLITAEELHQLVTQGAPGTPVGNRSILSYTGKKKAK
jgi:arginine utilization protein RocB